MEQGPVISGLHVKLYVKGPVITSIDGGGITEGKINEHHLEQMPSLSRFLGPRDI